MNLHNCFWNLVFACIIIFCAGTSYAKDSTLIDSLEARLLVATGDTVHVNLLEELAWEYRSIDTEKTLLYGEQGVKLARQLGFLRGEANCWSRIGNAYELTGEFSKAISAYSEALSLDQKMEYVYGIGRDLHQIGIVYRKQGDFDHAISYELQSIKILETVPDDRKCESLVANACNSVGNAYKWQGKYRDALAYFRKGLAIRKKHDNKKGISKSLNEIGLVYELLGMYQLALDTHEESLAISREINYTQGIATSLQNIGNVNSKLNQLDHALLYLEQSLELKTNFSDKPDYADLVHNIGIIYLKKGVYDQAISRFEESFEVREKVGDKHKMAESYYYFGKVNLEQEQYQEALVNLQQALALTQEIRMPILGAKTLRTISEVYKAREDSDKALEYYMLSVSMTDSLSINERQAIELDKQLTMSENNMQLLEKDLRIERSENQKYAQLIYFLIALSILILLVIAAVFNSMRQKQRVVLAEKDMQLSRNEIDDLLKTQEIKIMNAMVEGQDEERNRIAADLHDRLGGILSVVRLHFKSVEKNIHQMETRNQEQYKIATELLNDACDTVRAISHDIGDSLLLNLGLVPALQDLASTIESSQELKVSVIHHGMEERLNSQTEINVYKIVQELLSNILKHAEAGHITINLLKSGNRLSVMVEDDGVGFEVDAPSSREGMGMISMRSRVQEMEGTLSIDSQLGHGTTVNLEIPCPTLENSLKS